MESCNKTDLMLVREIQAGSKESFEELIERYGPKIYNLVYRYTKNPEDAEEVLQDVFSTIHRKLNSFQGKSAFSSWIYRVAVNAAFMKLRKKRRESAVFLEDLSLSVKRQWEQDPDNQECAIEHTYRREIRGLLRKMIAQLPAEYRQVFVMRDIAGLTNSEVSTSLGISVSAVKSRLHRARTILKRRLKEHLDRDQRLLREEAQA